ncbi:response regulator [Xylanibacillus composti]|uniref:Helix-turn-helix domain-containing protein n=1 Tax=Xylanibacillus composti TaxID=1572762 RepID=A0A8J4GZG5_9BACL|nr:response regulator [Xylanibacillus composti]MDT9724428.1 response regulator [Xylanibacillus composti]GIQ68024.1 helix-turn-helix domain-containing protein [Xylanibacillus composti]
MYRLLVVDDELFAIKGITQGIEWSDLQIESVMEAMDVDEAKQILGSERVDVLISDIEMPGENGLELLEWLQTHSPNTETIFLTGHANFSYAQRAIHLGSFDYVLKPVDHDQLKETVRKALELIREERELLDFHETYKMYYQQWTQQLPALVERFWQDVLAGRMPLSPQRLQASLDMYEIPLSLDGHILPVLISVEEWKEELSTRDEEIMEYALRKAAAEIILQEGPGAVIQDRGDYNLALIYLAPGESLDRTSIIARCKEYVQACNRYFYCSLSCYIGDEAQIGGLQQSLNRLLEMERSNLKLMNEVFLQQDVRGSADSMLPPPSFTDWLVLFEAGKKDELLTRIEEKLDSMQKEEVGQESLAAFFFGFMNMVYLFAHKKGLSVNEIFTAPEMMDMGAVTRSYHHLRTWATRVVNAAVETTGSKLKDVSAVIAKIQHYIQTHLNEELNREDLAALVYLNPAYVSRLFKKETGVSLSEYIQTVRMEQAKQLLAESNDKISSVAEAVGYSHFSHFAKLFKKITGITPQEYRKRFQEFVE